ncbi:hypothetical protein BYT27DRAFT_6637204 [Phlegmacium glaucopus]|nr:hypothetical protein BYT27DRAFT_6637204 [Phlegmacium glaucopus]
MKLKPLIFMQPYSIAHLRRNLGFQPPTSPQPPNTVLSTSHGPPNVSPNKSTSDIKGKQREADSTSSRPQLEAIPEDLGTSEERGLGSLARSSYPASSANVPLFSGISNSTADIYRRPEPPSEHSYPYNYHYSIPSASPPKSTFIPPKITINSPLSSPTGHSQQQYYTTPGSTFKSLGSTVRQIYPTTPSQSHPLPQASPSVSPQRRRSRDHPAGTTHNAPIRRSNHGIAPLTSDARTEHVLLAARRIGRERASLVAGILQHVEREKEIHARDLELMKARQDLERSEKERLERLANGTSGLAYYRSAGVLTSPQRNTGRGPAPVGAPRTPKRGGGVGATHYPGLSGALSNSPISNPARVPTPAGPSTFVFVNTSAAGSSGYSGGGVMSTPSQRDSVLKSGGTTRGGSRNLPSNPPTPLDSLLDAARSMMDDGAGAGEKASGRTNGTRKALEHPESPSPKRRRVSSSGSKMVGRGGGVAGASTGGKVTRVKSALDVLADQAAAAFDEPGQSRRGSNPRGKGKEKRKVDDEGSGSGGDGRVDNVQDGENVDRQDDFWLRGSTSASSRGRNRAKTGNINTRAIAESTSSSSMSLRPVRQASRKRLASQDLQPPPSISTITAGGKGKPRGRPMGSKSRPRSDVSVKPSSTMIPSLRPRVIVSAPTYSPLDEAIALQPQKDRRRRKEEHERSEEHSQQTTVNVDCSPGSPRLGLRPVVEWGDRGAEKDEGDEEIEDEDEDVSLVVTGGRELGLGQENDHVPDADGVHTLEASDDKLTNEAESVPTLNTIVRDMEETQINASSNVPTNGHVSPADVDLMAIPLVDDADAEADLDDEDAEGEQEEEEEKDDAEAGQDRSSRSRSPPPPDPPYSGAPSDSNDNDPDADADAEGEMEFEENDEFPSTSTSSAVNQTALSMPMGQTLPGSFGGSFLETDVWLIKAFWMDSDMSFGYNGTASIRVLISAMVPGSFPSWLSRLSDLSGKMSLQPAYPEPQRKSVVGPREGWWRNIDVKGSRFEGDLLC